ncbi:MAG: transglutaminase domain-containing protein [Ilumatobacteraceae bacterium]|nr:transglutaminase domain-containing protein [Ilumatobacteraceae bacterium]
MTTATNTRPALATDVGATAALTLFSLAVAAGFARVFSGWEFFAPLAWIAVIGHGAGLILRRREVPPWLAVPLTAVILVWAASLLFYRDTTTWLLPTSETWDLFRSEVELVRNQFRVAVAPVLFGAGWDALAAVGMIVAVLLADVFAFRAYARAEALVPGGVLFVFVAALGDDRLRIALTAALVASGVVTTIVLRAYHAPVRTPLRLATPIAIVAATAVAFGAGVLGPRLPGAEAEALYDTRTGGGGVTQVVSPLVDIRSRLTNRQNNEMFLVRTNVQSYWRSSALPEFDGQLWGLPERDLQSTDNDLARGRPGSIEMRHQVQISDLGGQLVPAAPDPIEATGPGDLRWNPDTSTIVTDELVRGDVFEFVSASPRFDPAVLQTATSVAPPDPIYVELPDDLPDVVEERAREVTAGATSSFEAARRLQDWFQSEFEYSLEVQPGHDGNAIESFLRERVGYCEQFAGTYAAMMRSLGIPARVAVGFTPGLLQPDGSYSVLGRNAHAWPEVWFDDLGWVPFEPTPGRGAPGAENYTGQPIQQDTTPPPLTGGNGEQGSAPTTTAPLNLPPEDFTEFDPQLNLPDFELDQDLGVPVIADDGDSSGGPSWWVVAVVVLALVSVAPAVIRRVRRRAEGTDPLSRLGVLWERSLDAVRDVGVTPPTTATPLEVADATSVAFPIGARPFRALAEAVTEATYAASGGTGLDDVGDYGTSELRQCATWTHQVERAVNDTIGIRARLRRYFTRW